MLVFSLRTRYLCLSVALCLAIAGCGLSSGQENTSTGTLLITATPTPTAHLPATNIEATTPPANYTIELRIPFQIEESTVVADPGEDNICLAELPLQVVEEGDRKMAHGSRMIECQWIVLPDPLPYKIHLSNKFMASFDGEVLPTSPSYPEGWIDGYLSVDGTTTQYYVEFQVDMPNLCPENSPCTAPGSVVYNLPFHLVDGDTIEAQWIFILRLD